MTQEVMTAFCLTFLGVLVVQTIVDCLWHIYEERKHRNRKDQ